MKAEVRERRKHNNEYVYVARKNAVITKGIRNLKIGVERGYRGSGVVKMQYLQGLIEIL